MTNVAVVGLGYWGPNRLRALTEIEEVQVSWICDSDPERLTHHARRHPAARTAADLDEILADPGVDAVILATPAFTHFKLASRVIESGRHAFVEKPLASSSGEARELVQMAAARNVRLMCGHTFLYSPPVRKVKDILDRGELGDLYFISSSRVNLGPYRSDVSVVHDLGPHDFSIFRYWLGSMPESVSAVGRAVISEGVADVAFVHLAFPDGLIGHVELSWLAPTKLRRTLIAGSEKMLVYRDGAPEPIRIYDSGIEYHDPTSFGEYQLSYRNGDIVSLRVPTTEPIVAELRDFIDAITYGVEPTSDLEIALDVISTVEAADLSMATDGGQALVGSPSVH